ncbi:MAG: hypothetical protein PHX04_02545 [Bacilli bacterium]|nr:hypothetical protein [Bacilli bacterium]
MKHKYFYIYIFLCFLLCFIGINNVNADSLSISPALLNNDSEAACTGLLGPELKKDLEQILKIIRIAGPLIVVILSSVEFIGAIANKDDDALKKCTQKLATRLILVAVLFFLPILLNILLSFIDQKYTTCIS